MDIQHVIVPSERPDAEADDLIILIDNQTVIRVRDFGTGEYTWTVDTGQRGEEGYDPHATIAEVLHLDPRDPPIDGRYWTAAQTFGVLATWWEPKTWAHAVMNVINNQ